MWLRPRADVLEPSVRSAVMVSDGFLAAPTEVIDGAVPWEDLGLVDSKFQAPWTRPGIIGRPALVERLTATDCPGRCGRRTRRLRQDHLARSVGGHQRRPRLLAHARRSRQRSGHSAGVPRCHHEQDRASRSAAVQLAVGRGRRRHELGPASPGDARVVAATSIRSRRGPHRIGDRPTLRRLARHGRTQPARRVSNRLRVTRRAATPDGQAQSRGRRRGDRRRAVGDGRIRGDCAARRSARGHWSDGDSRTGAAARRDGPSACTSAH